MESSTDYMSGDLTPVASGTYLFDGLDAEAVVRIRGNSKKITARWKGMEVYVNVPPGLPVRMLREFMADHKEQLKAKRPALMFNIGDTIDAGEVDITIEEARYLPPQRIEIRKLSGNTRRGKRENYMVELGTQLASAIGTAKVQRSINEHVLVCARRAAKMYLLPHARRCASIVGRFPLGWDVKDSVARLGCCSSSGIITLSPRLMFLPQELREFVIYHELAHLSEMNHGEAFHRLCDRYLEGKEHELRARLAEFRFPVF